MPILVAGPSGPIPMMVPRTGGPLVPYSLTGPNAPPPMPIMMTDPMNPTGPPKVMMQPPGGGPLVPYVAPPPLPMQQMGPPPMPILV